MKDLLLAQNHDLAIVNYDLALTTSMQNTVQKIKQKLLLFKGEWFLNIDAGIPYFQEILGSKAVDLDRVEILYIRAIQEVEEVTEIISFDMKLDSQTRVLSINFTVRDTDNNILDVEI